MSEAFNGFAGFILKYYCFMEKKDLRIVFMGTPEFAVESLAPGRGRL